LGKQYKKIIWIFFFIWRSTSNFYA